MAKGMDRGWKGHENKPKLTLKEKLAKRKEKKLRKQQQQTGGATL